MRLRRAAFVFSLLISSASVERGFCQDLRTPVCVAFSAAGALATAMLKDGELETRLSVSEVPDVTTHISIAGARRCEQTFSNDGKWLATVVSGNDLAVVIHDGKTGTVHKQFSSQWRQIDGRPREWAYMSSSTGGFLADNSLLLWRYIPRPVADPSDESTIDLHVQRWSVDGEMLSELNLGGLGFGLQGRQPIFARGTGLIWLPGKCGSICYKAMKASGAQIEDAGSLMPPKNLASPPAPLPCKNELLAVLGAQRSSQKAALLDSSGSVQKQVTLPHVPNLFGPLVPDWFNPSLPQISPDGEIAAVARTRVAWVLVDTDRDWGSEIIVLKTQPLGVATVLKTGKGGIRAVAIDHRNGAVRLVGFWNGRWHDMKYDDQHPGKWGKGKDKCSSSPLIHRVNPAVSRWPKRTRDRSA